MDDHYFVEIGQWLKSHPSLPYHFKADDAGLQNPGWEENGFVRMVNPLLHHYFLAFLLKVGGERVWFLRFGVTILSCFSGLFIFGLARRWTPFPFLTTLILLATPAFWLSAPSLLIDPTAAFFFLGALLFFVKAGEENSIPMAVLSGVFMAGAILSKYTAILILPVTFLWWLLKFRELRKRRIFLVSWAIPLTALFLFSWYTAHVYGKPHILAASSRMLVPGDAAKLVFFVFLSGVSVIPLVSWFMNSKWVNLILLGGTVWLAFLLGSSRGGFTFSQAGLISFWTFSSFAFVAGLLTMYVRWGWEFPQDYFLVGWLLGFIVMMAFAMPWVAARYYLFALPPLVFLSGKMIKLRWPKQAGIILAGIFVGMMVLSGALAYADYQQAESNRKLIRDLKASGISGGERRFYLGDSFTMSYMKEEGWTPCFPETSLKPGDLVLGRTVTMPLAWFRRIPIEVRLIKTFDYKGLLPIKVMDYEGSAGFYASVWGALPFSFSGGSWERYFLVEVTALR